MTIGSFAYENVPTHLARADREAADALGRLLGDALERLRRLGEVGDLLGVEPHVELGAEHVHQHRVDLGVGR